MWTSPVTGRVIPETTTSCEPPSQRGCLVITRDKDFGTLAVLQGLPHRGIVRLVELPPQAELAACQAALERYGTGLAGEAIVTVEPGRVRIRRAGSESRPDLSA